MVHHRLKLKIWATQNVWIYVKNWKADTAYVDVLHGPFLSNKIMISGNSCLFHMFATLAWQSKQRKINAMKSKMRLNKQNWNTFETIWMSDVFDLFMLRFELGVSQRPNPFGPNLTRESTYSINRKTKTILKCSLCRFVIDAIQNGICSFLHQRKMTTGKHATMADIEKLRLLFDIVHLKRGKWFLFVFYFLYCKVCSLGTHSMCLGNVWCASFTAI